MKTLFFFFSLFLFNYANSQTFADPTTFDYSQADSIALNFPKKKYKSYANLVAPLTEHLRTDHEKARVLFRWITDNIEYNYGHRTADPDKAVKNKKAVCIGYAMLFKEMCTSAGIECEVITGYSKTRTTDINRKLKKTDHAWNAIKLNDEWYLLDVTWATSYYDTRNHKFIKEFDELFYLTPPEIFAKNHLPKDKKWQLLNKPVSKRIFTETPVYYSPALTNEITALKPYKGAIKVKLKDTLEIQFQSEYAITEAVIELKNSKFSYSPSIIKEGNNFSLKQAFESAGIYELILFLNGASVASYKVEIRE